MTDQFSEQDIHNLFQEHLPPVELPPELAMAVHQRVMSEVAMTFTADDVTAAVGQEAAVPVGALDARRRTAQRATVPKRSIVDTVQERFSWWRFATGLALTGATAAIVLFFVMTVPGILPQDGAGDSNTLSPGAEVLPLEETATESASVVVQGGTATILRGGSVIGDVAPGGTAELYPGDGLVTLSGSAVIDYYDGQRTYVEPKSRVELVLMAQDDESTDVVLAVHIGQTQSEVSASGTSRFEVKSPSSVAQTVDGSFKIGVPPEKNETAIEVMDGMIELEQGGQQITIGSGEMVVAVPGEPLVIQTVASTEPEALAIAAVLNEETADTPTPVPTYTPVDEPTDTPTAEPTATDTPEPTATDTPEPTDTPTVEPTETNTPEPTDTPTAEPTETNTPEPTDTPTAQPTETNTPAPTSTPTPTDTPTPREVALIVPNNGVSGGSDEVFEWRADFGLADDEAYELIFWKPGQDPLTQGFGLASPTQQTRLIVDLQALDSRLGGLLDPGEYNWGVRIVKTDPYERVEFLGDSRLFRYTTATTGLPGDIGSGE